MKSWQNKMVLVYISEGVETSVKYCNVCVDPIKVIQVIGIETIELQLPNYMEGLNFGLTPPTCLA
jgi:hypothetical protein